MAVGAIGSRATDEWVELHTVKNESGNLYLRTRWRPEEGLRIRFYQPDTKHRITLTIASSSSRAEFETATTVRPIPMPECRFDTDALPPDPRDDAALLIKFRLSAWSVYVAGERVALLPVKLAAPTVVSQPRSAVPTNAVDTLRFQKISLYQFKADFMIDESNKNQLGPFHVVSGSWHVHTVLDAAREKDNSDRLEKNPVLPELSSNFYSLKGRNGIVVTGYEFHDDYSLSAAVQIRPGEMGLVFYYRGETDTYGFTIKVPEEPYQESLLKLWRRSPQSKERQIIAVVRVDLIPEQWVRPGIRAAGDRIECFLDYTRVIDVKERLPQGGKFGLYVKTDDNVIFDDLEMKSADDLDLRTIDQIRFHTVYHEGHFFHKRAFGNRNRETLSNSLAPNKSRQPQMLAFGSMKDRPRAVSAVFTPTAQPFTIGLLTGYMGVNKYFFRFIYRIDGNAELFSLEKVLGKLVRPVDGWSRTRQLSADGRPAPVKLMADATQPGELRLYRNGELVMIHHPPRPAAGACGIYIGPDTECRVDELQYLGERTDVYHNRFEKNRNFTTDAFMRLWSSPEGDWLFTEEKTGWHKSDFFGRFVLTMPYVDGSIIHLGVEEGADLGTLRLTAKDHKLCLLGGEYGNKNAEPLASGVLRVAEQQEGEAPKPVRYMVHYEDYCLWATYDDKPVFTHRLAAPFAGTRIRIDGYTWSQLADSSVVRYNVKDYLFSEAPSDWIPNGGGWQVINRFQCDPRWSHMNGESKDGVAAMWTKFRYRGDFCVELYAGSRQGWYDRCGDINLTVMNRETSSAQGYTVTCTGWDFNESQLWTRLFREGQLLERSPSYLVPRQREGNVRKARPAAVDTGRPVHGAWYYVKLRRIGNKFEYYFDNRRIFAYEDPEPLNDGLMGIWTFLNSMVVARVKIAADEIVPLHVEFTPIEGAAGTAAHESAFKARPVHTALRDGDRELEAMQPKNWSVDRDAGYARLAWHEEQWGGPYFVLRNSRGGGRMLVKSHLPPLPYRDVAGWRFYVKRTKAADFNFHYSIGKFDEFGNFVVQQRLFHRLSGTEFSSGNYTLAGATPIAEIEDHSPNWHKDGDWHQVNAWLPLDNVNELQSDPDLFVRPEGFGNLQPSDVLQGLTGNGPGAAYAVKQFTLLRYGRPEINSVEALVDTTYLILDPDSQEIKLRTTDFEEIRNWFAGVDGTGLTAVWLRAIGAGSDVATREIAWIELPQRLELTCDWDTDHFDSVVVRCDGDYPDRRFAGAKVTINGARVAPTDASLHEMCFPVPRTVYHKPPADETLKIGVFVDDENRTFTLSKPDNPTNGPPALLRIEGLTPMLETFEQREFGEHLIPDDERMRIRNYDPTQGTYLNVYNRAHDQRLNCPFRVPISLSHYPLMQFRYRAGEMTNISLTLQKKSYAKLCEGMAGGKECRLMSTVIRDRHWHSWLAVISDAMTQRLLIPKYFSPETVVFGSIHDVDQTGVFSQWDIDDVVFGPAISSPGQLAFTPHYFDLDGVQTCKIAIGPSANPYHTLAVAARDALEWTDFPNRARTVPKLGSRRNGFYHIFLKAVDAGGRESPVTDIPFLYDTRPPHVSHTFVDSDHPVGNGSLLQIECKTMGGAPLALSEVVFQLGKYVIDVKPLLSKIDHGSNNDTLTLNWPYLFRHKLNKMKDGESVIFHLRKIRDGAGNSTSDIEIPIGVDYASDKTRPALLPATYGNAVLWSSAWDGHEDKKLYFTPNRRNETTVVHKRDQEPFLETRTHKGTGGISLSLGNWKLSQHPYLTFRIRQPELHDPLNLTVVLVLDNGKKCKIPLTHSADGKYVIDLSPPLSWRTNKWCTISINIAKALKNKQPKLDIGNLRVRELLFVREKASNRLPLHLQSVFIHSGWKPGHTVTVDAYDASGLSGLSWEYVNAGGHVITRGDVDAMTLRPASLGINFQGNGWLLLYARDLAGNRSVPLRVPLPAT